MQLTIGNVQSVSKNFKNFSFVDENWPEKVFWQKISQHAPQMNGVPSINANILGVKSLLQRQDSKIQRLPSKNQKIEIFIANNSTKKNRRPKVWNMIDCEPVIVFIQKLDESD